MRKAVIKLAYDNPELRQHLIPILRVSASTPTGRKGPFAHWEDFLEDKYGGGRKRVRNPNLDTRGQYKEVAFSTAMKNKTFRDEVKREYHLWVEEGNATRSPEEEANW